MRADRVKRERKTGRVAREEIRKRKERRDHPNVFMYNPHKPKTLYKSSGHSLAKRPALEVKVTFLYMTLEMEAHTFQGRPWHV